MGHYFLRVLTRLAVGFAIACTALGCSQSSSVAPDPALSDFGFIPGIEYDLAIAPFLGAPVERSVIFFGSGYASLSGPVEPASYVVGRTSIDIRVGGNRVLLDPVGLGRYQGRDSQYALWTLNSW